MFRDYSFSKVSKHWLTLTEYGAALEGTETKLVFIEGLGIPFGGQYNKTLRRNLEKKKIIVLSSSSRSWKHLTSISVYLECVFQQCVHVLAHRDSLIGEKTAKWLLNSIQCLFIVLHSRTCSSITVEISFKNNRITNYTVN